LYENSLDYSNKALALGANFNSRPLYYKAISLAHLMEFDEALQIFEELQSSADLESEGIDLRDEIKMVKQLKK